LRKQSASIAYFLVSYLAVSLFDVKLSTVKLMAGFELEVNFVRMLLIARFA